MNDLVAFEGPDLTFLKRVIKFPFFNDSRVTSVKHTRIYDNDCIFVKYKVDNDDSLAIYRIVEKRRIYKISDRNWDHYNSFEVLDTIGWYHFVINCTIPIVNVVEFDEENSYSGRPQFSLVDIECYDSSLNFASYSIYDKLIEVKDFHQLVVEKFNTMREKMRTFIVDYQNIYNRNHSILEILFKKSIDLISFVYYYDDYKNEHLYSESDWKIQNLIDESCYKNRKIGSESEFRYLDHSVSSFLKSVEECYQIIGQLRSKRIELSINNSEYPDDSNVDTDKLIDNFIALRKFDNDYRNREDRFHESEYYSDRFDSLIDSNEYFRKMKLRKSLNVYLKELNRFILTEENI